MFSVLGSILLNKPDKKYIQKSVQYSEWNIPLDKVGDGEKIYLMKKKCLRKHDRINLWIDIFSEAFPRYIVDDAKRILFDLKTTGPLRTLGDSFDALLCLYISSKFHNFDFVSVFDEVKKLKGDGREILGIKRKLKVGSKIIPKLRKYFQVVVDMMPEKFERLEMMHKKLEGLNGKEMDSIQGNEPIKTRGDIPGTWVGVQEGIHLPSLGSSV